MTHYMSGNVDVFRASSRSPSTYYFLYDRLYNVFFFSVFWFDRLPLNIWCGDKEKGNNRGEIVMSSSVLTPLINQLNLSTISLDRPICFWCDSTHWLTHARPFSDLDTGGLDLGTNWARLTPNGTNLLRSVFSTFWLYKIYWKLMLKVLDVRANLA